ncbi:hypothetical protein PENSPDRAFT_650271 [Peniophora sp. CONT]|nr:hypothetical protein PENSPDRAFT_650271 [Peniophora sp. CONT]
MARSLRARNSVTNYAALLDIGDEDDAARPGPSKLPGDDDPGSDFAPGGDAPSDAEQDESLEMKLISDLSTPAPSHRPKGKGKTKTPKEPLAADLAAFERPSHRQMYTLPQPSVNHRHKAVPIFRHSSSTERLTRAPRLFGENATVSTNAYTSSQPVTERLNRALGYNVAAGPLWELIEDRGWFKEGDWAVDHPGTEASRRPRVYSDVPIYAQWSTLTATQAAPYLPTELTPDDGIPKDSSVTCDFGPFDQQQTVTLRPFETLHMSRLFPSSKSYVFNAGAPVWALDWCPIYAKDRSTFSFQQFLAVAPLPSTSHSPDVGARTNRPAPACIQLWALGPAKPGPEDDDTGSLRCQLVLCIDTGSALDLKWCPLPSHDASGTSTTSLKRLGLLAGTFEDGSVSIWSIPHPNDVQREDHGKPAYVHLGEPAIRLEIEGTSCWSLDWGNSEVIAVGCTNGAVAVYDIADALRSGQPVHDLLPSHYQYVHQSGVRAVSWVRAPPASSSGEFRTDVDPTVIASGGHDGTECLWDIRDPGANVMNRTRDVIPSMPWSPYAGGPVTIDHENAVKAYSISPSMMGRGHLLLEPAGPVWSASASEYHPQLAVGSADGSCIIANMLRSSRRGGMVPFFQHRLFQLDYSRTDGRLRMLDHLRPGETPDRANMAQRAVRARVAAAPPPSGTGAWPSNIAVTRVAWGSGSIAAAPLLASATASGLCRIDWLEGRWLRDRVPYGGIEGIRLEGGRSMDVDDEEESD